MLGESVRKGSDEPVDDITGQGTSMAIVGAYVLAGELATAGGDYRAAFARYERECRSYMEQNQQIARKARELRMPAT